MIEQPDMIIEEFRTYLRDRAYPCVAARAAVARNQVPCFVADHMACPKDDVPVLQFLYDFIKAYRMASRSLHSAAVIFRQPVSITTENFDDLLWQRLQCLSRLDARSNGYDTRVSQDPSAANFSFSLGEEAFFIIGLHPGSERASRKFKYPTLVFNPHEQFERMRSENHYEKLKQIVRKRDTLYSGSINPMLADFGEASEVYQYSGRRYDDQWTCPLKVVHGKTEDNPPAE